MISADENLAPRASDIPETPSALGRLDGDERKEFWASLALSHTEGIGSRRCRLLADCFGSAYAAVCSAHSWQQAGLGSEQAAAFRREAWREAAGREWEASRGLNAEILLWTDSRYPRFLRELPDAPLYLYCRGDMSLLSSVCVAIVGKRACSPSGMKAASQLAADLADSGMTVVSGLALGIDRAAHLAAVERQGSTIAVLGAGLDSAYPGGNRDLRTRIEQRGLVLTEYPSGTAPKARHFPIRNRIISGLSLGVVVVEARAQSGSLITARLALEQNRSVYVLSRKAGGSFSEGCARLLDQGAIAIDSAQDILRDLLPQIDRAAHGLPLSASSRPARRPSERPRPARQDQPSPAASARGDRQTQEAPEKCVPERRVPEKNVSEKRVPDGGQELPHVEDPVARRILEALLREELDAEGLCVALDLSASEVGSALIILEVQGLVLRQGNSRYKVTQDSSR